jgi:hypothetical protein
LTLFARRCLADCQSAIQQVANLRYGRFMETGKSA